MFSVLSVVFLFLFQTLMVTSLAYPLGKSLSIRVRAEWDFRMAQSGGTALMGEVKSGQSGSQKWPLLDSWPWG